MWSRAQLKAKAKYTFKLNYWKIVLVTLLIALISSGLGAGATFTNSFQNAFNDSLEDSEDDSYDSDDYYNYYDDGYYYDNDFFYEDRNDVDEDIDAAAIIIVVMFALLIFFVVYAIVLAIGMVWTAFIHNPIEVGTKRFFFKSLNEKAEVKEIAFAFDHSYKNITKIMFLKSLYTMFWSWLFIIPGIVKGYEYRMIPYLLAENPNLTKEQAFAHSKQMMTGQKWDAFVLDLSFIGWHILSLFTLGYLSIFYVDPYINMTNAALYEELSTMYGRPALNMQLAPQPVNPYQAVYPTQQPQQMTYTASVQTNIQQTSTEE